MLALETHLFLRISQIDNGPRSRPLKGGFNRNTSFRAPGMFAPPETSDAYFILSNDCDEVWLICNRHLRTVAALAKSHDFGMLLESYVTPAMRKEISLHAH